MPNEELVELSNFLLIGTLTRGESSVSIFLHISRDADRDKSLANCAGLYGFAVEQGIMRPHDSNIVLAVDVNTFEVTPVHAMNARHVRLVAPLSQRVLLDALNDGIEAVKNGIPAGGECSIIRCHDGVVRAVVSDSLELFADLATFVNPILKDTQRIGVGESGAEVDLGQERFIRLADLNGVAVFMHLYSTPSRTTETTIAMCRNVRRCAAIDGPCLIFNWLLAPSSNDSNDYEMLPVLVGAPARDDHETPQLGSNTDGAPTIDVLKAIFLEACRASNGNAVQTVCVGGDPTLPESYSVSADVIRAPDQVPNHLVRMLPMLRVTPNA